MNGNPEKDDGSLCGGLSTGIDMVSVHRIELFQRKRMLFRFEVVKISKHEPPGIADLSIGFRKSL